MKKNINLTPEQLEFLSLWSQGYSYVDIAKQIGKDESTLRRWRKREDIQLAMGAISQQKYEDTLHRDCLLYTSPSPRDATLSRMPSSA